MSPSSIPAEERQINLLLALRHSGRGLTKAEVLTRVAGYDPDAGASADRKFERDKDTLRRLGITIAAVPVGAAGCGTEVRYRIDDADYALPDIHLTAVQAAALEVAGRIWRSGTLPISARRALTKLRAITEEADGVFPATPDLTLDLRDDEPPEVLLAAADERRTVAFDYRSARSGRLTRRTVEPYEVRPADGAWYLDGWDRDAGAVRTFRLARVVGDIKAVGEAGAFERPTAQPTRVRAVLAVLPGRALALRARALDTGVDDEVRELPGRDVIVVESDDILAFAGSLAAAGEAVVVLGPEGLRSDVLAQLRGASAVGDAAGNTAASAVGDAAGNTDPGDLGGGEPSWPA